MNLDETPAEIAARSQMATALQQLGHALVGHRVDIDLAHEVAAIARDLTANVVARPTRDRTRELAANPRFAGILSGEPTKPIGVDGQPMDLFRDSIVSGRTNPMGIGLEVRRDGDAAVATTTLGQELRFTARLRDRSGRKLWIEAHGESDEGVFVRAEALFLAVELTHFANHTHADD